MKIVLHCIHLARGAECPSAKILMITLNYFSYLYNFFFFFITFKQPDSVRRDIKFARQLSISTKLKFPFPHMMAAVVREKQSGCLQLMSQGTADVILDSCVEYWDGHDLYPLTTADR